jgi:hypothetical protein
MFSASALFGRRQLALFIEERAHMFRQLGREKLDSHRVGVRALDLFGRGDFRRFRVHDSLLDDYNTRLPANAVFALPHWHLIHQPFPSVGSVYRIRLALA